MFGGKLDLFKKEWLDVVFENRNKEYGAYDLRKFAPRATNIGLLVVVSIVALLSAPKAFNLNLFPAPPQEELAVIGEVTLEDLEMPELEEEEEEEEPLPVMEEELPPQRIAEEPPAEDLIRFPEPRVVDADQVTEEIVSQEEIQEKNATPARLTLKGTPGATGVPTGEFGPKKVEGAITGSTQGVEGGGDDPNRIFQSVQIQPEYPGGMDAFRKWVGSTMQYPQAAIDAGVKGTIELTFVVERDGSLTDIKVLRDLGYGTGQAAVNLLKRSRKWSPGIQNGRPVRVQYKLPITLNIQN